MVSSSELDVIRSLDGVFFFFVAVFLTDAVGRCGKNGGSRGAPGGCSYVLLGSTTVSPLSMSG